MTKLTDEQVDRIIKSTIPPHWKMPIALHWQGLQNIARAIEADTLHWQGLQNIARAIEAECMRWIPWTELKPELGQRILQHIPGHGYSMTTYERGWVVFPDFWKPFFPAPEVDP